MTATISVEELNELNRRGEPIDLIDVRTPAEFREMHITFARNVPLDRLDPKQVAAEHEGHPLYVVCRSGSRGQQACHKLADELHAINVEGGTLAWEHAGLPLVRGRKTLSLERQVRIATGLLTLVGALLAFLVHPYFFVIPAAAGAGLAYAGVTDQCAMAMFLARMPWNQVAEKPQPQPVASKQDTACCGQR